MKTCRHQNTVEAFFDGEAKDPEWVEAHLADCAVCREYHSLLSAVRNGIAASRQAPSIAEPQFDLFMSGIAEGIERQPRYSFRGLWAYTSLVTAAILVGLALAFTLFPANRPVEATEIQAVYTDYDGATVDWYPSDDGSTTIWIKTAGDDLE
ncbi:MAG: hypothetical protein HYV27_10955 [Candidatus Hydrogenedentes bacterium]|nr:hypothetical protein [Candidatus Hydrogenedentota bacterium]